MADKIKIRRGLFADLPDLDEGELGYVKDRGTVYIGTNTDHNILLNPVLVAEDGYTIDGYLYPAVDNVHGLGTPDKRWKSVSVGPGSLHIVSKSTDIGYTEDSEFVIGVDPATNKLQIASGNNVLVELDSSTGASFPSGGTIDVVNTTETEHYEQQQQFNQSVIQALDAYGAGGTEQEHYIQQQQFNQSLIQALDGYTVTLNTSATGDGYLAFYTGVGRSLAGDNDLYFNRATNTLTLGGGGTYIGSEGTASIPTYAVGSSNTGIFQDASGNLAFTIGGTQYFQMTGAGTITTTAGGLMQLAQGNLVNVTYSSNAGSNTGIYFPTGSIMGMAASGNEVARISSGPNLFTINGNLNVSGAINNNDLSQTIQSITQATDGYVSAPNTAAIGDGYVAFFIDGGRQIAGDNDLYFDRVNSNLQLGGNILPSVDNVFSLGQNSPAFYWANVYANIFQGSGHTVFNRPDGFNYEFQKAGVGQWRINSAGNLFSIQNTQQITWGPNVSSEDAGLTRSSINLLKITNASTGYGNLTLGRLIFQDDVDLAQTLDGYASVPNTAAIGDGYVAFFIDGGRQIAGDNDLYWDRVNNRFGIGTAGDGITLPAAKLEVADNNPTSGLILKVTQSDHNTYGIVIGNDTFSTADTDGMAMYVDNSGVSVIECRGTANRFSLQVGGSDRIRILNTGFVGLGTTNPQNRLDVEGSAAIGATYSGTNAAPTNGLIVEGNTSFGNPSPDTSIGFVQSTISSTSTIIAGMYLLNSGTGDAFLRMAVSGRHWSFGIDNSDSDSLKIGTGTVGGSSAVSDNTSLVITTAGSVGVGGTPINGKFEVNTALDEAVVSTAYASVAGVNARGVIQARANGGGIIMGMNNTTHSAYTRGGEAMNGAAEIITFNAGDAITKLLVGNVNASPIHFIINDTKAATISADKNFGIGTAFPIEALTVVGAIAVNENVQPVTQDGYGKIWVNTSGELNFVDDNGNNVLITNNGAVNTASGVNKTNGFTGVDGYIAFWTGDSEIAGDNDLFWDRTNNYLGIGTVTPQATLQVNGDGYFDGSIAIGGQLYYVSLPAQAPTGTTVTLDFNTGAVQVIDLNDASGNVTVTFNNLKLGGSYIIKVIQDVSTPRNIIWPASVKWQFGTAPTISTASLAVDIVSGVYDGTNFYANIGQEYA